MGLVMPPPLQLVHRGQLIWQQLKRLALIKPTPPQPSTAQCSLIPVQPSTAKYSQYPNPTRNPNFLVKPDPKSKSLTRQTLNISIQTEGSPSKVWIKRHRQTDYPSSTDLLAKVLIFRESHLAPLDLLEKEKIFST